MELTAWITTFGAITCGIGVFVLLGCLLSPLFVQKKISEHIALSGVVALSIGMAMIGISNALV